MTPTNLLAPQDILWKIIESYGHDPGEVFSRVGLTREMLFKQGARIAHQTLRHLWDETTTLIKDPCLGLRAARFWHPSYFNALGYAWLASSTLREALSRFERYIKVLTQDINVGLDDTPDGLTFTMSGALENPVRMDFCLATMMAMCRLNFGPNLAPVGVHFIHPEPACSEKYFAFFKGPVYFDAANDCLILKTKDADQRLPGGNPHLAQINDRIIIRYLASLSNDDIVHRTQTAIIDLLPSGNVSDEKVARKLYLSERSLQRKLQQTGTSFRRLLDTTRAELAKQYIQDPGVDLTEIAFLLGFSEHSSFSRAYKRWTGQTPSASRRAAVHI
ncbi:MAG: AraC family transcriptional regulator [Desulfobacterales bacterium]|nr:AraC family transcriptional regulator [Desulfobacterales bacterium]